MKKSSCFDGILATCGLMFVASTSFAQAPAASVTGTFALVSPDNTSCGIAGQTVMTIAEDSGSFTVEGTYMRPHSDRTDPRFQLGLVRQDSPLGCYDQYLPGYVPPPKDTTHPGPVIATPCKTPASYVIIDNTSIAADGTLTYSDTWGQGCAPGKGLSTCHGVGMNNYQYTPTADGLVFKVWSEVDPSSAITCTFKRTQ
jgi:hypothetical protein